MAKKKSRKPAQRKTAPRKKVAAGKKAVQRKKAASPKKTNSRKRAAPAKKTSPRRSPQRTRTPVQRPLTIKQAYEEYIKRRDRIQSQFAEHGVHGLTLSILPTPSNEAGTPLLQILVSSARHATELQSKSSATKLKRLCGRLPYEIVVVERAPALVPLDGPTTALPKSLRRQPSALETIALAPAAPVAGGVVFVWGDSRPVNGTIGTEVTFRDNSFNTLKGWLTAGHVCSPTGATFVGTRNATLTNSPGTVPFGQAPGEFCVCDELVDAAFIDATPPQPQQPPVPPTKVALPTEFVLGKTVTMKGAVGGKIVTGVVKAVYDGPIQYEGGVVKLVKDHLIVRCSDGSPFAFRGDSGAILELVGPTRKILGMLRAAAVKNPALNLEDGDGIVSKFAYIRTHIRRMFQV